VTPPRSRLTRRLALPAVVAGGAVLVLVASLLASKPTTHRSVAPPPTQASPASATPTPSPAGQGISTLLYADAPGGLALARPDGTTVPVAQSTPSAARLVSTGGFVTYVYAGQVYALARPFLGVPSGLGPGDLIFPSATSGLVGVMRGAPSGPFTVRFVPVAPGLGLPRGPFTLPGGYEPIAEVAAGILVSQLPRGRIQLWKPSSTGFGTFVRTFGTSAGVVDVSGDLVAWRALDACDPGPECPMHISTISTGADRLVVPPDGHHGFLGGGAFDPSGNQVGAFVLTSPPDSVPSAELAIVPSFAEVLPNQGPHATVIPRSTVQVGEPRGTAAWSPDGSRVFFSGLNGFMHSYHPGNEAADTLNRPASYNVTVF
jgi:hypothetical protein